jgi:DNA-binding CsgD family transcriptional regulator
MDKSRINIAVIEPSQMVFEGLSNLLLKSSKNFYLYKIRDFDELTILGHKETINVVVLNPVTLQNRLNDFAKLKKQNPEISWIGLVYALFDNELLNKFDETISITDPIEIISQKINKSHNESNILPNPHEKLSERETDVLINLVEGCSNKEIAGKLNISVHTVASHRKNIIEKTGIKSVSGLTIYAISKKIISLEPNSI